MIIDQEDYLQHYGILRRSGRYPWGSGGTELARSNTFLGTLAELRKQGMTDTEIARGFGMTTTQLRETNAIARNEVKLADIAQAQRLKDKGVSNMEIGRIMGKNESSVRALLAPGEKDKADILRATSDMLSDQVDTKGYIDVGSGVEHQLGISRDKLDVAIARLTEQGYAMHVIQIDQLGTGLKTYTKVLAPPNTEYRDIAANKDKIRSIQEYSNDGGRSYLGIQPPVSIDPKRIAIRYAEDGGADADGTIYVRPGVDDISLDGSRYAQVRIAVNNSHYLKAVAIYKDDLPKGVDLVFNTNKSDTGNKLDAMKPMSKDPDNPFGSAIKKQITDPKTKKVSSAMNIVNDEGDWDDWSKNLAPQLLSKQNPSLAKAQLAMTYEQKQKDLDDILALTNPAVRRKLLAAYADGADASAVHLKAAQMPRQRTQVIIPVNSMKDTEIYAPNFKNGERVVLVRFPHGGIFEIPELTVNNNQKDAKRLLGSNPKDAVGINSKVAAKMSGADFDGDTVLVIPNNQGKIKTAPSLAGLKGFDPQRLYKLPPDAPRMTPRQKGMEMGLVSNLITDMTIKGAPHSELAKAVRHSMVVIDAEKHHLNYKQSAIDNSIPHLMKKYQDRAQGGSSTLISRATSDKYVNARKINYKIDPVSGRKIHLETGDSYVDKKTGKTVFRQTKSTKLAETDDAHTLSSGTVIEKIYADHSNRMKALANDARRELVATKSTPYSPSAKKAYAVEVAALNAKLTQAQSNRPLERQAQMIAGTVVKTKRAANPDMDNAEIKKLKAQALAEARTRTGASKQLIEITDNEWAAIQAGAITNNKLKDILDNANLDRVKELATPRKNTVMTDSKQTRARQMLALGYPQSEVAEALGVSLSTLKSDIYK